MLLILDKLCQCPFIGESATRTCECWDIGVMISGHLLLWIQVTWHDGTRHGDTRYGFSWYDSYLV